MEAALPFRTPQPLPSVHGDTVVLDVDSARQCTLFPRFPGETLDEADTVAVARAMHPAITDLAQLDELIGHAGRAMVERAADNAGPIYASLPTQLIHGDLGLGRVLVRAMELASGLASAVAREARESLWRPVLRGYVGTLRLDPVARCTPRAGRATVPGCARR